MKIPWDEINTKWGEIMKLARENEQFQQEWAFDEEGRVFTTARPAIESMICDKAEKSSRLLYYLQLLGHWPKGKGRIINVKVKQPMPMGTGGKYKKKPKK